MTLAKAELLVIDENDEVADTIPVQFNPNSMSLQYANSVDGGQSRGRQTQQYNGTGSTTLSLDLEFDTADQGTTADPSDVRRRTADVTQFVLPGGEASKQAPPRVRFRWGTFELTGVMSSLSEELTYFSSSGVPLRAKLSIQIKEQDARFEALESGPGANGGGGGAADRAAEALDGETPADFLARNGLAPQAWKALGGALDALADGIELEAGIEIGFDASLSVGLGVGISGGFQAGLELSAEASLGLEASAGLGVAASVGASGGASGAGGASAAQGRALAAAGGLTAATETAKQLEASSSSAAARSSFESGGSTAAAAGPSPSVAAPPASVAARAPLTESSSVTTRSVESPPPAPSPPHADRRATTYGRGVPLRDRVEVPGSEPDAYVVIGRPAPTDVTTRSNVHAPWEGLPAGASAADAEQQRRRPRCGCRRCDPFALGRRS